MPGDFYTFDEVLHILQIDEEELKRLISQGELRGIREGAQIKFRKADVDRLRKTRESEPTIILTDSDAELAVPSEEQLVIEDSHERETVAGVEIFETEELPTLMKEDETVAGAPVAGEETVVD
ncbi:MAG: helix-turn-helix domain-containing protein, partial [Planctomycetota bacterium]|nr:helix-turn-helix domain-containing protein [Planctomycetota bacterium]